MTLMSFLGIDPGLSGGLAAICGNDVVTIPMPETERDIFDWMTSSRDLLVSFAVIERVHAMPGNGVASMFKFGQNYGSLRMALVAAEIPFEEIQPRGWQKALGILPRKPHTGVVVVLNKKGKEVKRKVGGETDSEWKNRLRAKAQQFFPKVNITLATADALLIALYCKRQQEGTLR